MKQPSTPLPSEVSHSGCWLAGFAILMVYLLAFYLSDLLLLASSFDDWADLGFVALHADGPLVHGILPALMTLVCPLGIFILLIPVAPHSRRTFFAIFAGPVLLMSGVLTFFQILRPHTSKNRMASVAHVSLPSDHSHYLAYHPLGTYTWTYALAGVRDYYKFELSTSSMKTFLAGREPSEERKYYLLGNSHLLDDLPPELGPNPLSTEVQVYGAGHHTYIIIQPGSSCVLVICYIQPH